MVDKDILTARFGSDEAFGILYRVMKNGRPVSDDGHGDLLLPANSEAARDMIRKNDPAIDMLSEFPDGTSVIASYNHASMIASMLAAENIPVRIAGYSVEEPEPGNPSLAIAEGWPCPDLYFAIVNDRYLVDSWSRLVRGGAMTKFVFDLADPDDAVEARRIYAGPEWWCEFRDGPDYGSGFQQQWSSLPDVILCREAVPERRKSSRPR